MKVKARDIRKSMLKLYQEAIEEYNLARVRLEDQHNRIRNFEIDLKQYFDINRTHDFD